MSFRLGMRSRRGTVTSILDGRPLDAEVETEINKAEELLAGVEAIVAEVQEVNANVMAIVEAVKEQSTTLQSINEAVAEVDKGTQQNAAMVEESTRLIWPAPIPTVWPPLA